LTRRPSKVPSPNTYHNLENDSVFYRRPVATDWGEGAYHPLQCADGEPELERLAFIRHARDLGLTIDSIRQLIDLSGHPERPCGDADRISKEQLEAVKERIARLRKLEMELERIATCCTGETVGNCYVIRVLS